VFGVSRVGHLEERPPPEAAPVDDDVVRSPMTPRARCAGDGPGTATVYTAARVAFSRGYSGDEDRSRRRMGPDDTEPLDTHR